MAAGPGPRTAALLAGYGFELDDFQRRAVGALDAGRSVLVCAPTGAGKGWGPRREAMSTRIAFRQVAVQYLLTGLHV